MTDSRGSSTVVDVAFCLLLVGASVAVLASAGPPSASPSSTREGPASSHAPARETAVLLAAATTEVVYDVRGEERIATDTLAGLLAHAARLDAREAHSRPAFVSAVRRAVASDLDSVPGPVQVLARWRPYAGATPRGTVQVGASPPPDATVRAVTVAAPSGRRNASVAGAGFRALGDRLAAQLHPRGARQERAGAAFERELRGRFDRPADAAAATRGSRIVIVVRTWSA